MTRPSIEQRLHRVTLELRTSDTSATLSLCGYATVYGESYDVAGGPDAGGWREMVSAGAAKRTLNANPDVRLLINHDGLPLARTRSGTLLLSEDERGLIVDAPSLDLSSPLVQTLRSAMDRGDVDAMSFAFRVTRQEWNKDFTERTIREFALDVAGSDVSVVTNPANPATVAQLRAAARVDEFRSAARPMSLAMARAVATQISVRR